MTDPYRPKPRDPSRAKYRLSVGGDLVFGDNFADLIRELRALGFTTRQITDTAIAVTTSPGQTVTISIPT